MTLYQNDQENVSKCEELGQVYEKELTAEGVSAEALWRRIKGVGGEGEERKEDMEETGKKKEEVEGEVIRYVSFGATLLS